MQLLTVPCYFLGAAVYMTMAFLSDRTQKRGLFCAIFGSISVIGYGVLISPTSNGVHYFGCFLVAAGLYVVVGLPLAWVSPLGTAVSAALKLTMWVILLATEQLAKIRQADDGEWYAAHHRKLLRRHVILHLVSPPPKTHRTAQSHLHINKADRRTLRSQAVDKPRYIRGHAVTLSMVGMATCMYGFMWFWYSRENKQREGGHVGNKYADLSDDELAELGDESPRFRYTI